MIHRVSFILVLLVTTPSALAETLRVPQTFRSIQAAIDASTPDDLILVASGRYSETIQLKPGITLRSDGDDSKGTAGLKRAEVTVIDGGEAGSVAGVVMAEGSTLDGFTITNIGSYDDAEWTKHFDSHGEELGDDEGSVQAEGTTPAVSIVGVSCSVTNCIVHHNGNVGIGILGKAGATTAPLITGNIVFRNMGGGIGVAEGAQPIIRDNRCSENLRAGIGCRKANPIITDNQCFQNVRAGIGCREGSLSVIRGNKCYQNRRAGIGIRMLGTAPIVEDNECYENAMAGIGCRDNASPILRNNLCRNNMMAGIGCDGASPMIVSNECTGNEQAGIGVQGQAKAVIHRNKCHNNKLVAIGVTGGSETVITNNDLARSGGVPPIIAVKDDSIAMIRDNDIVGGGVAALLIQGTATVSANAFTGVGEKQGNAVWVWAGSTATLSGNSFNGYRAAVNSTKATLSVIENTFNRFKGTAIIIKDSSSPPHVYGNTAFSNDPQAKMLEVQGTSGVVTENRMKQEY